MCSPCLHSETNSLYFAILYLLLGMMDVEVLQMLDSLGLLHLCELFQEQCIDMETLQQLDDFDMMQLVPNIGHRSKIKTFIKNQKLCEGNTSKTNEPLDLHQNSNVIPKVFHEEKISPSFEYHEIWTGDCSDDLETKKDIIRVQDVSMLIHSPDRSGECILGAQFHVPCPVQQDIACTEVSTETVEQSISDQPAQKKRRTVNVKLFPENKSLKEFLLANSIGVTLMQAYEQNQSFEPAERQRLVHLIVDGVMEVHTSINKSMFDLLSELIVELFPNETIHCYFVPAKTCKENCKGKLPDRYRNQKRFISKYMKSNKQAVTNNVESALDVSVDEEMQNKIGWLQISCEPWNKVMEYWKATSVVRLRDIQTPGLANRALEKWPALKHDLGYTLVS